MFKRSLLLSACVAGVMAFASPAMAAKHKVEVVNKTQYTIAMLHASEVSSDDWEEDLLADTLLEPGETLVVTFDTRGGGCKYDFKGLFEDGDEVISNGVDVCKTNRFEFTP